MNDIIKALQFEKEQLEARIRILEDKIESDNRQISEYDHELRQAKRLLKAAVEDNKNVLTENFGDICQFCKHGSNPTAQCCKPHNGSGSWCCENAEWRYADEAERILKGE